MPCATETPALQPPDAEHDRTSALLAALRSAPGRVSSQRVWHFANDSACRSVRNTTRRTSGCPWIRWRRSALGSPLGRRRASSEHEAPHGARGRVSPPRDHEPTAVTRSVVDVRDRNFARRPWNLRLHLAKDRSWCGRTSCASRGRNDELSVRCWRSAHRAKPSNRGAILEGSRRQGRSRCRVECAVQLPTRPDAKRSNAEWSRHA